MSVVNVRGFLKVCYDNLDGGIVTKEGRWVINWNWNKTLEGGRLVLYVSHVNFILTTLFGFRRNYCAQGLYKDTWDIKRMWVTKDGNTLVGSILRSLALRGRNI